ncbi:centromere protein J [Achroia grisella]|uniref:centromere protein J n=1 Tax=Achroia grisella TaxID=688607 RepID=UPI0027D25150|nr:centromere protein J [Achroia grisella]
MDKSYSENDVSLSPSQILERLRVLRQLQLLQREKLEKQQSEYQDTNENSSSITEMVSHFSNSTSYNTFHGLLQLSHDVSHDAGPRNDLTPNVKECDLLEGVSILNLSRESEFIVSSPNSIISKRSSMKENETITTDSLKTIESSKKQISLDEMPVLAPKKGFEQLVLEKLQKENTIPKVKNTVRDKLLTVQPKPFLKRGEGMARFGLDRTDLKIQNTKSLPWRKKELPVQIVVSELDSISLNFNKKQEVLNVQIDPGKITPTCVKPNEVNNKQILETFSVLSHHNNSNKNPKIIVEQINRQKFVKCNDNSLHLKSKHPLQTNKVQTWGSVFSKEQNDFLMQLKKSNYYKNFSSPAKSTVSDISCEESELKQEKEKAEQNLFELLENKVSHESFNLENSFFNRFLRKHNLECSGESTPLIMQKCLVNNPDLLHISSHLSCERNIGQNSETCNSEYTECTSDACSSVSSCCSCRTIEPLNEDSVINKEKNKSEINTVNTKKVEKVIKERHQDDTDIMKANMVEMNAKLIATSDLLKDRLHELEDEIETFRKENANLSKMREEIDTEKQKFYEEKISFEQKFNEEKILSEYYIAEEKEKLNKQKLMYERYVREIRGKLNKKEKDEVQNLRKEIHDLKEEIRIKDAKSTSTIARLRNQIKIVDKENKELLAQVEKLKKENKRIQHSNEVTRRLTNIKYLEQINKKLSHMTSKTTQSEVEVDKSMKYKSFEIERQSRSRRIQPSTNINVRPRAKSVPNLNVTSRYAKYFSQRDAISQMDKKHILNVEHIEYSSDNEDVEYTHNEPVSLDESGSITDKQLDDSGDENNLEKIYLETFRTISPKSNRSSLDNPRSDSDNREQNSNFSNRKLCKSPIMNTSILNWQKNSIPPNKMSHDNIQNRSKSPPSCFSNSSSHSLKSATVITTNHNQKEITLSPESSRSKKSVTKTKLTPTEIKKPDGSRELRFPNGNIKYISHDGCYSKFVYYNGDIKENFYKEGRIKYFYAETKTFHTTHSDGLEVLEFSDGQVEKRYKDGSSEIRLPNGSIRYFDPKNEHVREEWRFPDGAALTVAANGEQRIVFGNGQIEVHTNDHKRREFPDGTVKLVYNDGTSETRYASGRIRIKDKHGNLIMDSAPG